MYALLLSSRFCSSSAFGDHACKMQTAVSARIACLCTPKATPRPSLLRSTVHTSFTVRTSSSVLSTPLRQQHKGHLACSGRRSHATVRAAAATGATFYDYSVKVCFDHQRLRLYSGHPARTPSVDIIVSIRSLTILLSWCRTLMAETRR